MDFLILPIGWKNWLLLISAFINLVMVIFIFNRGIKNKVNLYFSLLALFCFLWSFSVFGYIALQSDFWSKFWFQTSFIGALGIALFLFYFVVNFPFKNINLKIWQEYSIWVVFSTLILFTYTEWNLINFTKTANNELIINFNYIFQIFFSLFFIILVISALYILWVKYKQVENIFKKDALILFCVISIGLIFGVYFNLFLDYMGNFQYEWFGPVFTVPMNLVVIYLIFSKRDKQVNY